MDGYAKSLVLLILSAGSMMAGCSQSPGPAPTARERLGLAEERILAQRLIKQRLLKVDPIERQVEQYLGRDPRVASARCAISIPEWGNLSGASDPSLPFTVVVTVHEPMSQAQAQRLLDQACESAGYRLAHWDRAELSMDQNTWGLGWTLIIPLNADNPDLSVLPRPGTTMPSR